MQYVSYICMKFVFFSSNIYVFFCCVAIPYFLIWSVELSPNAPGCGAAPPRRSLKTLWTFPKKCSREKFRNQKPKIDLLKFILMGILCIWHALRLLRTPRSTTLFVPFVESAKFFKLRNDCMRFCPPNLPFKLSHPTLLWGFVRKGLCHEGWPHQMQRVIFKGWKQTDRTLCAPISKSDLYRRGQDLKAWLAYSFAWICAETRATLMSHGVRTDLTGQRTDCPSDGHCECRPVQFQLLHELWNRSGARRYVAWCQANATAASCCFHTCRT